MWEVLCLPKGVICLISYHNSWSVYGACVGCTAGIFWMPGKTQALKETVQMHVKELEFST